MALIRALKAFFRALTDKEGALRFLEGKESEKKEGKTEKDSAHLRLLHLLQHQGRHLDFLKEDITAYTDAQVGAAVRTIHEQTSKSLEEVVTIRPVMEQQEGDVTHGWPPSPTTSPSSPSSPPTLASY